MSSLQKCDVAPESITIRFSILLGSLLSHLFDLGFCSLYIYWLLLFLRLPCFHPIVVGSSSLLRSGEWYLFYSITLCMVATPLFLLETPRTFRCFWLTSSMMLGVMRHSCPVPSIHLPSWRDVSFRSVCKSVRWGISFVFLLASFSFLHSFDWLDWLVWLSCPWRGSSFLSSLLCWLWSIIQFGECVLLWDLR